VFRQTLHGHISISASTERPVIRIETAFQVSIVYFAIFLIEVSSNRFQSIVGIPSGRNRPSGFSMYTRKAKSAR
jgi:hypothetical protein